MPNYTFGYEDDEVPLRYSFGDETLGAYKEFDLTPTFSYAYLDFDETDFCFNQNSFDNQDCTSYFKTVKALSNSTINDLIDNSSYKTHFHFYPNPNQKLRDLLNKVANKILKPEERPSIGQFSLYTSTQKADRSEGIKSPRIYFFVGNWAVLYILFYDPYHEINPGKSSH